LSTPDVATVLPAVADFIAATPGMIVGGEEINAAGGELEVVDPSTDTVLTSVGAAKSEDVDHAVKAARSAFEGPEWRRLSPSDRGRLIGRVSDLIDASREELAQVEALDSGKPLALARAEMVAAADAFRYYAGWPTKVYGETIPSAESLLVYSLREPLGVSGAIIPWNFPLVMASWKVAPALAFGNTVVLKPAEQTPLTALRLGQICLEAGIPAGVVNVVPGLGPEAGAALAKHPDVDHVAFTGSTQVGKLVHEASTTNLKRVTLELGGKSPNVVLSDADFARAGEGVFFGAFLNAGQVCTAGSRILVEDAAYDDFVVSLADRASATVVGAPLEPTTQMGPVVSREQMERVMTYIEFGREGGAELVSGGGRKGSGGYFVEPTVFADVDNGMRIAQEEIFGPVAAVIRVRDFDEAISVANDTIYGLAAAVWTRDVSKAVKFAKRVRAGTVWINTYGLYDPSVSFGGFKASGHGRELGRSAVDTYTQSKSVWMNVR
jgi:acyl-CoA reductase-like NAD-dependent aldehyde dehydrogenase